MIQTRLENIWSLHADKFVCGTQVGTRYSPKIFGGTHIVLNGSRQFLVQENRIECCLHYFLNVVALIC